MNRFLQTGVDAFSRCQKDRCGAMGASLAFIQTLVIAPFFVSVLVLLSRIVNSTLRFVIEKLGNLIGELLGSRAQSAIDLIFRESGRLGGDVISLSLLTIVALLLGGTEYFMRLGEALRSAWGLPREDRTMKEALRGRLASLGSTAVVSLMLFASLIIGLFLFYLGRMALVSAFAPTVLLALVGIAVVSAMYFAITVLCYRWIPDATLTFKGTVQAVLLVTGLQVAGWALASLLVANQGLRNASAIVNILVILLVYLFYFNFAELYGAEFILASARAGSARASEPAASRKHEAERAPV